MPTGTRKLTPALDAARETAARYPDVERVSKKDAVTTVMRVAAALGLPAGVQALLNALFAASDARDWLDPSSRPIVWPSNERLCQQLGVTLPTLRRFVRTLVEAGLVVPHDSPNGKRWGRRDANGRIVIAYGFDLSPIAVRHHELQELAARLEGQRAVLADLRRTATILRKRVEMAVDAGLQGRIPGDWIGFKAALEQLLARYPRLSVRRDFDPEIQRLIRLTAELRFLVEMVENTYREAIQQAESTPKDANSDTHIRTTTEPLSEYTCSKNRRRSNERHHPKQRAASGGAFGKKPEEIFAVAQDRNPDGKEPEKALVSLELVAAACPEILSYAQAPVRTWNDLVSLASQVRPWLGISPDAWDSACKTLGAGSAATAVAVILQKQVRAQIKSPGGYLRGMVAKAEEGELHLARTLYGLANSRAAA